MPYNGKMVPNCLLQPAISVGAHVASAYLCSTMLDCALLLCLPVLRDTIEILALPLLVLWGCTFVLCSCVMQNQSLILH